MMAFGIDGICDLLRRSDCVFTIHVEQKSNGVSTAKGIRSKITLIDMAGAYSIRNNNLTRGQ